jgi:hypothetical protein
MKNLLYITITFILGFQTINSQCLTDRHSTTWYDGWVSCETSANPNSSYGDSHWIMYDFGFTYTLFGTQFWNVNDPANLNYGIMDYSVDYSTDGNTWTNLGNFTLSQASGLSTYQGEIGPNFGEINARYVLITPTSNYGGSCFGFSEVKFYLDDTVGVDETAIGFNSVAYPNPFSDTINIRINTQYPNIPLTYSIYDILGRNIYEKTITDVSETNNLSISNDDLHLISGIYFLKIKHNNQQQTVKIVKR